MNKSVIFGEMDPLDMHNCMNCQHRFYDMETGYYCDISKAEISRQNSIRKNDCSDWKTPFENDFKRVK